jgi:type VI protein secretion system component Hcp
VFSNIVVETTANFGGSRATFSTITLNGATITSLSTQIIGDDTSAPVEQLTIQASSIEVEYIRYDSEGSNLGTITETVICGKPKDK